MNSAFGHLFLSLQALIANLADGNGNKYFPFVDQDLGQLDMVDNMGRYPVSWPCVLIDIDQMTFGTNGMNSQQGSGRICLRMGFPAFSASANITPDTYKQKALYYYDLEQVLHQALQGQAPSYTVGNTDVLADVFGSYQRISAKTELRRDAEKVRVRELVYTIGMNDYTTQDTTTLTPAALNLTDVINIT